jgi:hypothetical protein
VRWLEVIKLRSARKDSELLKELLLSIDSFSQKGLIETKTYHHAAFETDLSVHLYWKSEGAEQDGSTLGLRIVKALKEFGLTDHSVWVEEEK